MTTLRVLAESIRGMAAPMWTFKVAYARGTYVNKPRVGDFYRYDGSWYRVLEVDASEDVIYLVMAGEAAFLGEVEGRCFFG